MVTAKDTHTGGTSADVPLRFSAAYTGMASSWVAGSSYTLVQADVDLKQIGTIGSGVITLDIFAASSELPTGSTLGTSTNTITASTVSTGANGGTYTFTFSGVSITSGSTYCFVFTGTFTISSTNYIREVGGTVTTRIVSKSPDGTTTWTTDTSNDQINFTTYAPDAATSSVIASSMLGVFD
jgi:hypothetical protein